jgi:hypothetical protein
MVHTSTVAFAVLALKAASALAAPAEYSYDLAQREFDSQDLEARELDYDLDFETREVDFDLDAREFDFDFEDMVEREVIEFDEDIIARATTTSLTTSATSTATATGANPTVTKATTTTTTHVAKPTGKNKKETKTVVITVLQPAAKCRKLTPLERLSAKIKAYRKRSQIKAAARRARRKARKEALRKKAGNAKAATTTTATTTSATSTSTSSKSTTTAAATGTAASKTATANWMAITPPPKKSLAKGVIVKESKKKGKDGHTTIRRTVTAAPTACAALTAKKSPHREYKQRSRRDLEDVEDLFAREYDFDELD